jgi:hypothetical protein
MIAENKNCNVVKFSRIHHQANQNEATVDFNIPFQNISVYLNGQRYTGLWWKIFLDTGKMILSDEPMSKIIYGKIEILEIDSGIVFTE